MKRLFGYFLIWVIALYGSSTAFSNQPDEDWPAYTDTPAGFHIALLLPLDSPALEQAALAVRNGFSTAAKQEALASLFDMRVYATTGQSQDVLDTYQRAIHDGAVMVIGPLTRDGVKALAQESHLVTVPTLALNSVMIEDSELPLQLYFFGLDIASEAQYIAQLAATSRRRHAVIIADRSDLSKRLKAAFANEWIRPDNTTSAEEVEISSQNQLSQLYRYTLDENNIVFLALNGLSSRAVRLFIHHTTPVYATSLVFTDSHDPTYFQELDSVRFTDMPWLLQPELAAVKKYRHPDMPAEVNLQRFYALGVDAFQLTLAMMQTRSPEGIVLDGVTGYISFKPPNQFSRRQIPAIFKHGRVIPEN